MSHVTVTRLWKRWQLQPWRSEPFKSTDPQLIAKVTNIVGLYLHPSHNAIVLCVVMAGEQVVDVPCVAVASRPQALGQVGTQDRRARRPVGRDRGPHPGRLRTAELEDFTRALGLILDRRRHLVDFRHRTICRLHALLAEMVPGGAPKQLTAVKAAKMLRSLRPATPVETERREVAKQLLDDWRWCDRRIPSTKTQLHDALEAHGTSLTQIFRIGDIGAATILTIVGDVRQFRSAGHFAAYNGTAPIEASTGDLKRHRLNKGGNRQLNSVIHIAAVTQVRHNGPGKAYLQRKLTERKTNGEAMRALKRQPSDVIYRRLVADARRREAARGEREQVGTELASA